MSRSPTNMGLRGHMSDSSKSSAFIVVGIVRSRRRKVTSVVEKESSISGPGSGSTYYVVSQGDSFTFSMPWTDSLVLELQTTESTYIGMRQV